MALQSVSSSQPAWLQEVINSYITDPAAQQLLTKLAVQSPDQEGYSLSQGLIRHNGKVWVASNFALQTKIIAAMHSSPIGGHLGVNATYYRVKNNFCWKGLKKNVHSFVRQCQVCQKAKHSNEHPVGRLQPLPIPQGAW